MNGMHESAEYTEIQEQRVVDRKSRKRRTWGLGIACFVVFLLIIGGFLWNINRLANDQRVTLNKIEEVQDVQAQGASRSYMILSNVQCNGQADAEYNAKLADFITAALADDPNAGALAAELQALATESAARCPTILPPVASDTTTTTAVPEGGDGATGDAVDDAFPSPTTFLPEGFEVTTTTSGFIILEVPSIPGKSKGQGQVNGKAGGQEDGKGKNG